MKLFLRSLFSRFFIPDHVKWPELAVIGDSLLNEPEDWYDAGAGDIANSKLGVRIANAIMFRSLTTSISFEGRRFSLHHGRRKYLLKRVDAWVGLYERHVIDRLINRATLVRIEKLMKATPELEPSTINLLRQLEQEARHKLNQPVQGAVKTSRLLHGNLVSR